MPKISILFLLLELYLHLIGIEFGIITTTSYQLPTNINVWQNLNNLDLINNLNIKSIFPMNEINVINIFNNEELNNLSVRQEIRYLLLISSLLSLILGTLVGLAQTRIKRLLAYMRKKNCELNYQTPENS